jgi:hypothetical protein
METPTVEWQKKYSHDKSHTDGKTRRVTYRRKTVWETYLKRGNIDRAEKDAADKLTKIWLGSMGVDVREGDNINPDPLEYPQTYYAQKLADARSAVKTPRLWSALMMQLDLDDLQVTTEIGRKYRGIKDRAQAHAAGMTMLQTSLEILALHWGIKQR